jgi:RNA polymerase-binding transcription factor DksA
MSYTGAMNEMQRNKCELTESEIRGYQAILVAKRDEILCNVSIMKHEALLREGTDNYEIENTLGLIDSERKLLGQIDEALQRIEEGTYGVCAGDGHAIPKQRLDAIPWAKFCVGCAKLLEKGGIKKEDFFNKYDFASGIDDEDDDLETYGKGD